MSNTEPQIMKSRQLATIEPQAVQSAAMARMDAEFRMAEAIARAGSDMLPRAYNGKPGAVILVQQWANRHDVDILTAMQTVAFVQGRPVIDATMQRALAERAGYEIRVVEADRKHAIVEVWRNGSKVGGASYTWEDGTTAGLTGKDNWKKNPEDMLVARATTRAIKRHAPSVMLGFVDPDDAATDSLEVLTAAPAPAEPEPEPIADVVDAEIVPDTGADTPGEVADDAPVVEQPDLVGPSGEPSPGQPEPEPEPATGLGDTYTSADLTGALKAGGLRQTDALRHAASVAESLGVDAPGTVQQIAGHDNPALRRAVAAWIGNGGEA